MKRFNIGYLSSLKSIGYPVGIQVGVKNAIEEQGHNMINIADLLPVNFFDTSDNYFHFAFELASRLELDLYIVPIGAVRAYIHNKTVWNADALAHLLDPNRTLILEDEYEGYHTLIKDNKPGMHELMRHLIEKHGYKNIACVSGPETSYGAREREGVYFEEMEKHGLSVTDAMFTRGVYSGMCDDVIESLLDGYPEVEAIVCANDHLALETYRVLKQRGLTPGTDVAVTGFDDDPAAAFYGAHFFL